MIQRLGLHVPADNADSTPSPKSSADLKAALAARAHQIHPAAMEEVKRRTEQIRESGKAPEALFVCRRGPGLVVIPNPNQEGTVMLLFTTVFAARDYLRVTKAGDSIYGIKLDSIPQSAQGWMMSGCHAFILNKCPRCSVAVSVKTELLLSKPNFTAIWAVDSATRSVVAEAAVRRVFALLQNRPNGSSLEPPQVMQNLEHFGKARQELENLRDHITCAVPYVHQMIGLIASTQNDTAARDLAVERLKEFGPQFESCTDMSRENMVRNLATAFTGMMLNFVPSMHEQKMGKPAVLPLFQ